MIMSEDLQLAAVRKRIEDDLLVSDLLWSLLIAAMSSYRHDSVLKPFPPMYRKSSHQHNMNSSHDTPHKTCNYDELKHVASTMPSLKSVVRHRPDKHVIDLLHWTLNTKHFTLQSCHLDKFREIERLTGQCLRVQCPDFIFQLDYSLTLNDRFERLRSGRNLMYAYHGSRVENFHSILHYGLNGRMSKNAVFGEGTYLSSELSVSLAYSPLGQGWVKSSLGSQLGCVAVCEIIDDPSVKCTIQQDKSEESTGSSRSRVEGSMGGDVPEKYYVVRNDEMIRVVYILVYTTARQAQRSNKRISKSVQWIREHVLLLVVSLYVLLLLLLGLYKSTFWTILRHYV